MSNPFYYLVGLLLALSYPTGSEPLAFVDRPGAAGIALAAGAALLGLLSAAAHRAFRRDERVRFLPAAKMLIRTAALAVFAVLIYVFHWPLLIWRIGLEDSLLAGPLLALSPLFLFTGILAWTAARVDPPSAGLGFLFRGFLAFSFLPVVSMLSLQAMLFEVEAFRRATFVYPVLHWIAVLAWVILLLLVLPVLIRVAFAARPLPPGPLRDRLEEVCRRAEFRCTRLLEVKAGRWGMANAFIVGMAATGRYVFFTEAILTGMRPDELECVLAHEIVHSKRRHILCYLVFTVGSALVLAPAFEFLEGLPPALLTAIFLAWSVLYWFVGFGFISRRFETEADLGAARLLAGGEGPYGGAGRMAGALERVAWLNHMPTTGWSWRHFNIATRMAILEAAGRAPESGRAFERVCARIRAAAAGFLFLGVAGAGILAAKQAGDAPERAARLAAYEEADRAVRLGAEGKFREAAAGFRRALSAGLDDPHLWIRLADCERALGRDDRAREAEDEARRRRDRLLDPRDRLKLLGRR